jgi:predicted O-linked N-acetylglucosamine transferase (SPINDLY family)
LQTYQQADIILDPFPHTGGVVGMEQLYMGVPIVTLYGTQASGRSTSSTLTAMGRTDWIARSREEYVEIAVRMAGDIPMLTKVRKTLRDELLASPVIAGYVDKVEDAYRAMWEKWIG